MARGKVSIHDLAEQVGLSAATVSRVLNNRHGIGRDTRQRVLDAARELRFRPRVSARPTTIGVVMDQVPETLSGHLVAALTMQVAAALARHQLAVEIFTRGNLGALAHRFMDGLLAIVWEPDTLAALRAIENVPVVIFNRPEFPEFSNVQMDDVEAGRLAARHLIERGHTRLGFLGAKLDLETTNRLRGFREASEAAGLELPEERVGITRFLASYSTLQRLVRSGATGLFTATEELSIEIPYLATEAMRLTVPEDLSLVGISAASMVKYYRPPLTVVAPPVKRMAESAVAMLEQLIESADHTRRIETIAPELIVRDSVTRPPSGR